MSGSTDLQQSLNEPFPPLLTVAQRLGKAPRLLWLIFDTAISQHVFWMLKWHLLNCFRRP